MAICSEPCVHAAFSWTLGSCSVLDFQLQLDTDCRYHPHIPRSYSCRKSLGTSRILGHCFVVCDFIRILAVHAAFFFSRVFSPTRWRGLTPDMAPDIGETTTANIHYKHMVGTEGGVLMQSTFCMGVCLYYSRVCCTHQIDEVVRDLKSICLTC